MFVRWFDRSVCAKITLRWAQSGTLTCLFLALLLTAASTTLLVSAVLTEHWEHIAWDHATLSAAPSAQHNWTLDWLLDGQVAHLLQQSGSRAGPAFFLSPMNGGIWTLCASFDGMQNLSISCALVCLIILCSSALVGAFGVLAHQISAVLVTGVLYMLAATFATFTLTIIHLKRTQAASNRSGSGAGAGTLTDGVLPSEEVLPLPPAALWSHLMSARRVSAAWSLHLGWSGVVVTVLAATLWIALSKAMRHNPLNT